MRFTSRLFGPLPVGQWLTQRSGGVKSVQRNTITITNGNASNTRTIEGVDPANTRLVYLGNSSVEDGTTSMASTGVRLVLTNATTITASRLGTVNTVIVSFEVIEYYPGTIRLVQRGTVTATGAASGTATLGTALQATGRATLDLLGWDYNVGLGMDQILGRVVITNTTTITLTRVSINGNLTAGFQVTEWL